MQKFWKENANIGQTKLPQLYQNDKSKHTLIKRQTFQPRVLTLSQATRHTISTYIMQIRYQTVKKSKSAILFFHAIPFLLPKVAHAS